MLSLDRPSPSSLPLPLISQLCLDGRETKLPGRSSPSAPTSSASGSLSSSLPEAPGRPSARLNELAAGGADAAITENLEDPARDRVVRAASRSWSWSLPYSVQWTLAYCAPLFRLPLRLSCPCSSGSCVSSADAGSAGPASSSLPFIEHECKQTCANVLPQAALMKRE